MYTFKAQDKSNAKRFLTKTCKVDPAHVDQYLDQQDGQWGTWIGADGKPAPVAQVKSVQEAEAFTAEQTARTVAADTLSAEADAAALAPAEEEEEDETPSPAAAAFGAFAAGQLTATPVESAKPEAKKPGSTGLKIEKNRPTANGITQPSAGTTCAKVWDLCTLLSDHLKTTVSLSVLVKTAEEQGINKFTARTQYACWRKFNNITGRIGA